MRDGAVHDDVLPAGVVLRPTAAPLLPSDACRVGVTPVRQLPMEPGSYVALVRAAGHRPRRVVFSDVTSSTMERSVVASNSSAKSGLLICLSCGGGFAFDNIEA